MKALIDTNVVLDAIAAREPFYKDAQKVLNLILDNKLVGYITASSVTDIYYIARKYLHQTVLQNTMRYLFRLFVVIDVLGEDCLAALDFFIDDYEDALITICGNKVEVDYIITRDADFLGNVKTTPVITPADFLARQKK
ncbi:MAG: PIN domain-containing protein [Candidatus Margulisbacteria bacterium]|jgi:predicted nucleic acid-binding protein|nr:PIN domain-containing protein [Candidatus Margulisiibacteriota bacterium]